MMRKFERAKHSCLLPILVLASCVWARQPVDAAPPKGFTALFNGKDLTGWKGLVANPKKRSAMSPAELASAQRTADERMRAHWKVVDGALEFDGKGDSLCTVKDYGDFEMFVDWKILEGGDSGIYLRGSPQVQIWDTEFENYWRLGAEKGSGALWNNRNHARFPSARADRPAGQWNTFHLLMIGERLTVKLNGQLIFDQVVMENYWERDRPIYPAGQIELQNHGNKLWFRNISIREISNSEANRRLAARDADLFTTAFNGQDFSGWKGDTSAYEIRDEAIVCKKGQGGNLFTARQYSDFVARLEFKLPPGGNNGIAIRFDGSGRPHVNGLELQVLDSEHSKYAKLDPRQYHGSVYGLAAAHRGYLRPTGAWNFEQITVRGSRIIVELNGFTILDTDLSQIKESKDGALPPGVKRTQGHFGFAGHNDPVAFRKISLRELPGKPASAPSRKQALSPGEEPIKLFNGKNLDNFYTYLQDGAYTDPKKVFTVQDGMIRISGDGFGGLITSRTYRDYHLVIEFKWGQKTWGGRVDRTRDSGVLVHCHGPDGGYGGRWMASIEAQIIEGGVGDLLVLTGKHPQTGRIFPTAVTAQTIKDRDGELVWKQDGQSVTISSGRINWWGRDVDWKDKIGFRGRQDVESPLGEWTRMDVISDGPKLTYLVNGVVVNRALTATPDSGKILLQTELAEMFVRRIELWPLGKAPVYTQTK